MEKITVKQAVINVCEKLEPGTTLLGYQLIRKVRIEMLIHGNFKKPLGATILREYRLVKGMCEMDSHIGDSKYRKLEATYVN